MSTQILKPIADEKEDLIPLLRILWWESQGTTTADMKRAAEGSEGDAPRKLSVLELEARRWLVTKRLVETTVTLELGVSDSLITGCVATWDGNRLRYILWEVCTTRSLEMVGQKKDEVFAVTGYVKAAATTSNTTADAATGLKVDQALRRRGLTLEMADAMSWECHEKL